MELEIKEQSEGEHTSISIENGDVDTKYDRTRFFFFLLRIHCFVPFSIIFLFFFFAAAFSLLFIESHKGDFSPLDFYCATNRHVASTKYIKFSLAHRIVSSVSSSSSPSSSKLMRLKGFSSVFSFPLFIHSAPHSVALSLTVHSTLMPDGCVRN